MSYLTPPVTAISPATCVASYSTRASRSHVGPTVTHASQTASVARTQGSSRRLSSTPSLAGSTKILSSSYALKLRFLCSTCFTLKPMLKVAVAASSHLNLQTNIVSPTASKSPKSMLSSVTVSRAWTKPLRSSLAPLPPPSHAAVPFDAATAVLNAAPNGHP